jgi:hypothetical protein
MKTTKSNDTVMVEPAMLPTSPDNALARFNRLRDVLEQTHSQIPSLLAREQALIGELGAAEVAGDATEGVRNQLNDVFAQRESASRQRSAATNAIVALEPDLQATRQAAEQALQAHASQVTREFMTRYAAAVAALQTLWSEGEALGHALRVKVPMPVPVKVAASAPAAIDPVAATLGEALDSIDAALALAGGIRHLRQEDARHYRLCQNRGVPARFDGVYRTIQPFRCYGLEFSPGQLVNAALVSDSLLYRLSISHHVRPVELAAQAA